MVAQGQLASWGSRLGAYLIDGLVLLIPGLILFFAIVAGAVGISGTTTTTWPPAPWSER